MNVHRKNLSCATVCPESGSTCQERTVLSNPRKKSRVRKKGFSAVGFDKRYGSWGKVCGIVAVPPAHAAQISLDTKSSFL